MALHPAVAAITARIQARSVTSRAVYLDTVAAQRRAGAARGRVS